MTKQRLPVQLVGVFSFNLAGRSVHSTLGCLASLVVKKPWSGVTVGNDD